MEPGFVVLGVLVGTLVGMTGVGAGSLVTPALMVSGVPAAVAVGTDLAYAAISKTFGALAHRLRHALDLRLAALLALGSVPSAGLTLAFLASPGEKSAAINAALAVALVLTALVMLAGRGPFQGFAARFDRAIAPLRVPLTVGAGALLGVLVTLSSVGAGALGAVLGLAAMLLAGAVPGIVAGSLLAGRLPDALVRRLLALVLLYAGLRLAL
jgi:hypothetical protein